MRLVTLLTNLSLHDTQLPALKAQLVRSFADVHLVDIGHSTTLNDLWKSAYLLSSASHFFPEGTIHCVVNCIGEGEVQYVLARRGQSWFVAPDSGLLPFAFPGEVTEGWLLQKKSVEANLKTINPLLVETIDDLYKLRHTLGRPKVALQSAPIVSPPRVSGNRIDCNIMMADNYGNVLLNFTREMFVTLIGEQPFRLKIPAEPDLTYVYNHYNEVPAGSFLCRFNKQGYLELAINRGRAVDKFMAGLASTRNIHYQYISIFFGEPTLS